jgi:hypothetical protein
MVTLICLALGGFIGFASVKSGTFREGGGLVLLGLSFAALVISGIAGALSAFFPPFGGLAAFLIAFVGGVFITDHLS